METSLRSRARLVGPGESVHAGRDGPFGRSQRGAAGPDSLAMARSCSWGAHVRVGKTDLIKGVAEYLLTMIRAMVPLLDNVRIHCEAFGVRG